MKSRVKLEMPIEDLIDTHPKSVRFLSERGVRCIRCGEPLWCTLGELLEEDGIRNPQELVEELNQYLENIEK